MPIGDKCSGSYCLAKESLEGIVARGCPGETPCLTEHEDAKVVSCFDLLCGESVAMFLWFVVS